MTTADPLRKTMSDEAFWARAEDVLPAWMKAGQHLLGCFNVRLGPGGTMRLVELLGEAGGLTPREAQPWFEVEDYTWARIERILLGIFQNCRHHECVLPVHLERWVADIEVGIAAPYQPDGEQR